MDAGTPSRTARAAALQRAVHQVLEQGRIFSDPLAVKILGEDPQALRDRAANDTMWSRGLRFFLAVRSRFAEDALAAAVRDGVRQLVVLGAGLDTFAYRNPYPDLRVFEVDHPATQAWKRERLAAAGITPPESLCCVELDFERGSLEHALRTAGFDESVPTFVFWLGVVVYLTAQATWSTLRWFADLPAPVHVVFDYANPLAESRAEVRDAVQAGSARVAAAGEPWINFFDTAQLHHELRELGYAPLDDLGPKDMLARYQLSLNIPSTDRGAHVIHAATT